MSSDARPATPTRLALLAEEFLAWCVEEREYSRQTATRYRTCFLDFQRRTGIPDPASVNIRDLNRYATVLGFARLPLYVRRGRLQALKTFFRWLHSRRLIEANPAIDLQIPRRRISENFVTFSESEIRKLIFNFTSPTPKRRPKEPLHNFEPRAPVQRLRELRDTALLAAVYSCALRADEPSRLERRDYYREDGQPTLCIKAAKWSERTVHFPLDPEVAAALDAYLLELDRRFSANRRTSALFPSLSSIKSKRDRGISRHEFRLILKRRIQLAGIDPKHWRFSPHSLRKSRATHLHKIGMPLQELQSLLRHKSMDTTAGYITLSPRRAIGVRATADLSSDRRRLHLATSLSGRDREPED